MRAVRRSHAYDAFWAEIILEVLSRSKLSPSMACMKTRHCLFKFIGYQEWRFFSPVEKRCRNSFRRKKWVLLVFISFSKKGAATLNGQLLKGISLWWQDKVRAVFRFTFVKRKPRSY